MRVFSKAGLALAAASLILSACTPEATRDAAYFVANPDKIDAALAGCKTGATAAEECQQIMMAQQDIARTKRIQALEQQLANSEPVASADR